MKFQALQESLSETLAAISGFLPSARTVIPRVISLKSQGEALLIESTDRVSAAHVLTQAIIQEEGEVVLSADELIRGIQRMPKGHLSVGASGGLKGQVSSGKAKLTLPIYTEEVLLFKQAAPESLLRMENGVFWRAYQSVEHAAARGPAEQARPILGAVQIVLSGGRLEFAAADGICLAHTSVDVGGDAQGEFLVPSNRIAATRRIFKDEGELAMSLGDGRAYFSMNGAFIDIATLDGRYPNWRAISKQMAERPAWSIEVSKEELLAALRLAEVVDKRTTLEVGDGALSVRSSGDDGQSEQEIAAKIQAPLDEEPGRKVSLQIFMLVDALSAIPGESAQIKIAGKENPVVLSQGDWRAGIMPLYIKEEA